MKKSAFNPGMPFFWLPPKFILIMKLIVVIMTAFLMQVSAKGLAQRITLNEKGASLQTIIQKIRYQTGYDFLADLKIVKKARPVSVNLTNVSLEDALDNILKNQDLTYSIEDRLIVLKTKESSFLDKVIARFQAVDVRGKIVGEDDKPLAGALITVKGSTRSARSNADGEFYLQNVNDQAVLIISYIGYASKEVSAGANLGRIVLQVSNSKLDEVQVQGYGITSKRLSTGNITTIKTEDIAKQPLNNPLLALQGRVSGLNIVQTNGLPGSNVSIEIRGKSSLSSGTGPLYVIDGVPYEPNTGYNLTNSAGAESAFISINPADIGSIEILKDADATAIYGSRGANGVILITSKKATAGTASIDVNVSSGINQVPQKAELMQTAQYLQMRRDAFKNDGATPTAANAPDLLTWDQNANTDWQELLFGKTGRFTDAQVSLSGGSNTARLLFSTGYHKETTTFAPSDLGEERFSARLNADLNSKDSRFNANSSVSYSINQTNLPMQDGTSAAFQIAPNYPLYNPDGSLYWGTGVNPVAFLRVPSESKSNTIIANTALRYHILPGLDIRANLGYNRRTSDQQSLTPLASQNPASATSSSRFANSFIESYIIEPQLDYKLDLGGGQLSAMIGSTWQQNKDANEAFTGTGYSSDAFLSNLSAAGNIATNSYGSSHYRYNSIFTRIGYNWKNKYLANVTFRRDGSSRFGPGKKFGNFGALGLGWIFSEESLIKEKLPFLSFGKLRGSYGITGNEQIGNYNYLSSYTASSAGSYQGTGSLWPQRLVNTEFGWEENRKLELTMELGFFNDRIFLSGSYYRNRSGNALIYYPLPSTSGFQNYQANFAALVENSGWEFLLNTVNIKTDAFRWETSFNIGSNDNKLISFPGIENTSYGTLLTVGKSMYQRRMINFLGVDPQTGLAQFEDYNKDGVISWIGTNTDLQYYDNGLNDFAGGMTNTFTYKNFRLDFLLDFVKRKGSYSFGNTVIGTLNNRYIAQGNYWKQAGDVTNIPRPSTTAGSAGYTSFSDWLLSDAEYGDASYVKLRNVSAYYTLPEKWIKRTRMRKLDVFVRGQNLLSVASFKSLDPQTGNLVVPPLRVITTGINCQF
jgi:TonB-linked SusC/RagA family outer membrane protein